MNSLIIVFVQCIEKYRLFMITITIKLHKINRQSWPNCSVPGTCTGTIIITNLKRQDDTKTHLTLHFGIKWINRNNEYTWFSYMVRQKQQNSLAEIKLTVGPWKRAKKEVQKFQVQMPVETIWMQTVSLFLSKDTRISVWWVANPDPLNSVN